MTINCDVVLETNEANNVERQMFLGKNKNIQRLYLLNLNYELDLDLPEDKDWTATSFIKGKNCAHLF